VHMKPELIKLSKKDFHSTVKQKGSKTNQCFTSCLGTSIGAINAAILVSYVKENKTWKGSDERLVDSSLQQFAIFITCYKLTYLMMISAFYYLNKFPVVVWVNLFHKQHRTENLHSSMSYNFYIVATLSTSEDNCTYVRF
jgi:predicted acylesterase/phospholipase RssA